MNMKNLVLALSLICFSWNALHSMEAPPSKKQRENEEQTQAVKFEPESLLKISMQAFFNQKPKNLTVQLNQNPLPEELINPLLNRAFASKQNKRTLITLFKVLPLDDYADIAVDIAYSTKNFYLPIEDKLHIFCILREIQEKNRDKESKLTTIETKKILNTLRKAFSQQLKDFHNAPSIHSTTMLFHYSLNNKHVPSKMIQLLLKHGLPHDTSELVGNFVKTFEDIHDQKLRTHALEKLSLLIDAQAPLYNEVFESIKAIGKRIYIESFPTPYHYLQYKIASLFKQEYQDKQSGKIIDADANEQTKAFYQEASGLLRPRS